MGDPFFCAHSNLHLFKLLSNLFVHLKYFYERRN